LAPKGELAGAFPPNVNGFEVPAGLLSLPLPKVKGVEAGLEADGFDPNVKLATVGAGVDGLLAAAPNRLDAGTAGVVGLAILLDDPNILAGAGVLAVPLGADEKAKSGGGVDVALLLLFPKLNVEIGAVDGLAKENEAAG
jgi:hypothetical protein